MSAIFEWNGPMGLPDFAAVRDEDYAPAFEAAMKRHVGEIAAIANNPDEPTFDNTIVAMEKAGNDLSHVSSLFWNKAGTDTNDAIQALEREIAPKMSRHYSAIVMNGALFARVDALWKARESLGLNREQERLLERTHRSFVRAGAALDETGQKRLAEIGETLAGVFARFGQNVLADEKNWAMFLDGGDLDGIPAFLADAMAAAASARGEDGRYAVTLSRSLIEPFLTFSARRDLRETAFKTWIARGENEGETDNRPLIGQIIALRDEKARLLGFADYAAYKLDDTMAKTPEAVAGLLGDVWTRAVARAAEEAADLAALAAREGDNHEIEAWDWRYYAEKLKAERFSFSEAALKPYLPLENMIEAAFDVAGRLFGIRFEAHAEIAGPHEDARVFSVVDRAGKRVAIFIADYFNRPSKRSGAWMSGMQSQHRLALPGAPDGEIPIILNVMNFSKPAAGKPALLSLDDARTLFHEFGHALHGMLSDVTYPSLSGTAVSRDFVELPSQLYEHWLTVPEVLEKHARHYETGEPLPKDLLDKVLSARTFNAGFAAIEFTASALVDMAWHDGAQTGKDDVPAFEAGQLTRLGMPKEIVMRHRSPHFLHVFSGEGYSAGYYSYMWSEVLDADAFAAFEEAGDPFDPATAGKLKTHIYSAGGSADPADLYTAFRGRMPEAQAMLEKRGLA